jgi:hypothetical protein
MTPSPRPRRRKLAWVAACLVAALLALVLLRKPLAAAAIAASLRGSGAGEVSLAVTEVTPWTVQIEQLGFQVRAQRFDAARVRLERANWWRPTLGVVRVENARVPVTIDGSDTNPWAWSTYRSSAPAPRLKDLWVPAEEVTFDGVFVLKAAGQREEDVRLSFSVRPAASGRWSGTAEVAGQGLAAKLEAEADPGAETVDFRLKDGRLDLAVWQGHLQSLVVLPGGRWELAGQVSGGAEGRYAAGALAATGRLQLRDGRVGYPARDVAVEGVAADLTFTDVAGLVSEPGELRARELRVGAFRATDVFLVAALAGPEKVAVMRAALAAFDGRLEAEPFALYPRRDEIEATVRAERLSVEALLALAPTVPAKATGRVDGRLPFRIDAGGLRLGTGWLALTPGERTEVQIDAAGLLTRGVAPATPAFITLQRIESGLLRLELSELRLDIRAPGLPAGRSATLRVAGEPVDKSVKAPISLDLNVNGPIEALLNMGLDNRVRFGGSK